MVRDRLQDVYDATGVLLRTVDALTPEELAGASVLPGWTRAHVVAHVALNALGFARAIDGARHGRSTPVYDSSEARDSDIDAATTMTADGLREFTYDAAGRWREATEGITDWDLSFERTPGGPRLTLDQAVGARWREVEIHHADLDVGYSCADWPPAFTSYVFVSITHFRDAELHVTLETPEGPVELGDGGPVVRGSRADLAWWLLGRGAGEGLEGDLPSLGPWR